FTSPNEQPAFRYDRPVRPEFTCNVAYIQAVNYVRRGRCPFLNLVELCGTLLNLVELDMIIRMTKMLIPPIFLSCHSLGRREEFQTSLQAIQWSSYGM